VADITSKVSRSSSHLAVLPLEFVAEGACFEQGIDHSEVPLVNGVAGAVALNVKLLALFKLLDTFCGRIVYLRCERHIDKFKVGRNVEGNRQILVILKF